MLEIVKNAKPQSVMPTITSLPVGTVFEWHGNVFMKGMAGRIISLNNASIGYQSKYRADEKPDKVWTKAVLTLSD